MKRALLLLVLLAAACRQTEAPVLDAKRGQQLMTQYNCTSCHVIPGVPGPRGMVGPPLDQMATRKLIAGKFPNTLPTMSQWLQNPQSLDPQNAMPNLGVTASDARDMAAYLATLR